MFIFMYDFIFKVILVTLKTPSDYRLSTNVVSAYVQRKIVASELFYK